MACVHMLTYAWVHTLVCALMAQLREVGCFRSQKRLGTLAVEYILMETNHVQGGTHNFKVNHCMGDYDFNGSGAVGDNSTNVSLFISCYHLAHAHFRCRTGAVH